MVTRKSIPIYERYKEKTNKWERSKNGIEFKYYRCDYCGAAIVIRNRYEKQDGGEFELKPTRLRRGSARVVAHSVCLNKMLKEIDEIFDKKNIIM